MGKAEGYRCPDRSAEGVKTVVKAELSINVSHGTRDSILRTGRVAANLPNSPDLVPIVLHIVWARLWRGRGEGSSDQAKRSSRTKTRPSPGELPYASPRANIGVLITLSTLHQMSSRELTKSSPPIAMVTYYSSCVSRAVAPELEVLLLRRRDPTAARQPSACPLTRCEHPLILTGREAEATVAATEIFFDRAWRALWFSTSAVPVPAGATLLIPHPNLEACRLSLTGDFIQGPESPSRRPKETLRAGDPPAAIAAP
ncbi:hypothetical protein K449DRAFT_466590 [Hypoxylon sp. EC38]|nr:hypothetical protein K449DRAFT_466590 [Hypoxylon sp. EC38]